MDPELLIKWAKQLPDVDVVPILALVKLAIEYRQRHPNASSTPV
ncbi:hypothetical protein [Nocardia sp. NPDC059239]